MSVWVRVRAIVARDGASGSLADREYYREGDDEGERRRADLRMGISMRGGGGGDQEVWR